MLVCKFVSRFYLLLLLFNSILSLFFFPLERTIQFWCVRSQWKSLALWQQNEANSEQYKKRIQTNANERAHTNCARIRIRAHTYIHNQWYAQGGWCTRRLRVAVQLRATEWEREWERVRPQHLFKIPKNCGILLQQPWRKKTIWLLLSNNYKLHWIYYLLLTLK